MKPEPTRIEPMFSPRIWGARSLAPLYPEKSDLAEPLGEAWLTGVDCKVATGPFVGKTLGEAWQEMAANWRGEKLVSVDHFPMLVKFIFPNDKLSIQVHPDDAYASMHEAPAGVRGKTEMWHAVSAEPGAKVLVGVKPGVDKDKFLEALTTQHLENLFQSSDVLPGDTFFVPAGTPHTIGAKMVLCEVQEYSDLTYRVYDYGRVDATGKPRELHVQKALEVIDFKNSRGGKVPAISLPDKNAKRSLLAACPFFATERWEVLTPLETQSNDGHFELLIVLSGRGTIRSQDGAAIYKPGECWLIPATLGEFTIATEVPSTLIRTFVPDMSELRGQLKAQGIAVEIVERAVFD